MGTRAADTRTGSLAEAKLDTLDFYDRLAPYYDLIYKSWESSIDLEAAQLNGIIEEYRAGPAETVLEVSCGIGTQAIGLAKLGYTITASDLSPRQIERARREAARFGVEVDS